MDQAQVPIICMQSEPVPTFIYKWILKDFELYMGASFWQQHIYCYFKISLPGNDATWRMELAAPGRNESIWMIRAEKENVNMYYKYQSRFSLLNSKNQKFATMITQQTQMLSFFKTEIFRNKELDLLNGNRLTICCEVFEQSGIQSIDYVYPEIEIPECKLKNDLQHLFESQEYSDIILCSGKKEFKAHKSILAFRSPVFKAMFSHDMQENNENRVEITDISEDILDAMLKFIYSGESPINESGAEGIEKALALAQVADKYQLDRLKSICELFLSENITSNSVSEILSFAELFNMSALKELATEFKLLHVKNE